MTQFINNPVSFRKSQSGRQSGVPKTPSIVVKNYLVGDKNIHVVRDDLLPGGTKQRGVIDLLLRYKSLGQTHFVYASPFCGYAQVALSYVCGLLDLKCVLYCEKDVTPGAEVPSFHPYSKAAKKNGAKLILTESLAGAEKGAANFAKQNPEYKNLPLGFNCEEFYRFYQEALQIEWAHLVKQINHTPETLWLPVGSGTLVRSFLNVVSPKTTINAVNVNVLKTTDLRISNLRLSSRVKLFASPQAFREPVVKSTQFPSNIFYDAKLQFFIEKFGKPGDVWWNVAK